MDVDWDAVYPVKTNARLADYPEGSELHARRPSSTRTTRFLELLTRAFTGQPELLIEAVGEMFRIKEMTCH